MKSTNSFSRREFVRTGIFSSVAVTGVGAFSSCSENSKIKINPNNYVCFQGENWNQEDGPGGLLFSQIGYETGLPVRIAVRLPKGELLPANSHCRLIPSQKEKIYNTSCVYWGEIWKSHWWVAEFTEIPVGSALPASMICHIGKRWAGTWFQTRGVICNGFSTGEQLKYDMEPKKENDGPFSFTDEDWIPHSAAWLTGLMRL